MVIASDPELNVNQIQPCTHVEADYRMVLHAAHAYEQGLKRIVIHASDTDVLVIAILCATFLNECELWLAFGHANISVYS